MKNIAIFASGKGTNLQAIIDRITQKKLHACCVLVVSDRADALALKRARKAGLNTLYADPKEFASKDDYEKFIISHLKKEKTDLVVLAGFMRIVGPVFLKAYRNRIINIHPALLPAFKGGRAIKDAFAYGVKVTGVTVHFVDEKVDHGPIILQEAVVLTEKETFASLEAKIHRVEHRIYAQAIEKILSGRFMIKGRKGVACRFRQ